MEINSDSFELSTVVPVQDTSEHKVSVVYHGHIYSQSHVYKLRENCTIEAGPCMVTTGQSVNRGALDQQLQGSECCAIEAGPFIPQEMVVIGQFTSPSSVDESHVQPPYCNKLCPTSIQEEGPYLPDELA